MMTYSHTSADAHPRSSLLPAPRLRVIDPAGDTLTINAYDNLGRLDSAVSKIKGDTLTGKAWQKVQHYYDVASRVDSSVSLRTTTSGAAAPTWPSLTDTTKTSWSRVRYDVAGRDSARINNRGYKTRYVYDRLGRLTARYPWADSSVAIKDSVVYDLAGNVVKTITRRGQDLTANFDSRNRDTLTVIPGVGTIRKTFGGPLDQLTRMWVDSYVDSIGGINPARAWRFDQRGRLLTDTSFTGSTARTLVYAYDSYERNYRTTDALGQWDMEYETNRGYPVKLKTPLADTLEQIWDTRSRPDVFTLSSNGVKVSFDQDWNAAGALLEVTTTLGPTPWLAGKWKMLGQTDANSAIHTRWYEKKGSGAATDSTTNLLGYDGEERLTAWDQYGNGSDLTETYAFDATANLTGPTYVPRTDQLTGDGTWSYTYDHAGNLVGKTAGGVSWVYGYDGLNRLVSARRNGTVIVRYAYDVTGRRMAKRVYSSASGGTVAYTRFVYRGAHVAFETDSAGTIGLRYIWGVGTDELVGFQDGGGNHYYVARDKLGSIRNVATRSGTWVMRLRYTPYGTTIDSTGTGVALRYRWTGREWDAETGMYYFRARYYDPGDQPVRAGGSDWIRRWRESVRVRRWLTIGGEGSERARQATGRRKTHRRRFRALACGCGVGWRWWSWWGLGAWQVAGRLRVPGVGSRWYLRVTLRESSAQCSR